MDLRCIPEVIVSSIRFIYFRSGIEGFEKTRVVLLCILGNGRMAYLGLQHFLVGENRYMLRQYAVEHMYWLAKLRLMFNDIDSTDQHFIYSILRDDVSVPLLFPLRPMVTSIDSDVMCCVCLLSQIPLVDLPCHPSHRICYSCMCTWSNTSDTTVMNNRGCFRCPLCRVNMKCIEYTIAT